MVFQSSGTICGAAVLFLLEFMHVLSRELQTSALLGRFSALHEATMFWKKEVSVSTPVVQDYAPKLDFCRIFAEDMTGLYRLSLLLTADAEKAEQCFMAGLGDSIQGNQVFKEWARSWSKRMVIKNAIRMISPAFGQASARQWISYSSPFKSDINNSLLSVLQLAPFERFAFVMSVLEGYPIQECSTLLSCTKQDVVTGRTRALMSLAGNKTSVLVGSGEGFRDSHFSEPAYFLEPAQAA
jgi:hypothetical protein